MQIWPAIDLLGGNCVRLRQGDYNQDTIFSNDPGGVASRWFDAGAQFLHCVDLDGAKSGSIVNHPSIKSIVAAANGRPVQLGGGVRNQETIKQLIDLGLSRLVVGTAALKAPDWFARMCDTYPGHLVLGLDAKDGMVATEGWLETSSTSAVTLVADIAARTTKCVAVVYTDIAMDGMLQGPNLTALQEMQRASPFPVIASGGVTTLNDIHALVQLKTAGAIIGRALYEAHLSLADVLAIDGTE